MIPNGHATVTWVDSAPELEHKAFPFIPGGIYFFQGMHGRIDAEGRRRWVFPPGRYRLVGSGPNVRTYQELVCYQGVGGKDDGKFFMCPLADFAEKFTLPETSPHV